MLNIQVAGYKQISKAEAQRIFNDAGTVYLCAANLRPGAPYYPEYAAYRTRGELNFIECCNAYSYYNCTCNETGRYIRYYKLA